MIAIIVLAAVCACVVGLLIKVIFDHTHHNLQIQWAEYAVCSVVIILLIAPLVGVLTWRVAKAEALSYNEYWNGWETAAVEQIVRCTKDGPCEYEYSCDPYECNCYQSCDSEGKNCRKICDTCYHDCPYFDYERKLSINTTIGSISLGQFAPEDYKSAKKARGLPSGFNSRDYMTPTIWLDCKNRVESGIPGPVTRRMEYDNYILASDRSILKQYSDHIETFKTQNLLPELENKVHNVYYANKVYFVGYQPTDIPKWQNTLMNFNSALGTDLQGDLHLVVVQNDTISSNPESYSIALKAYWQDTKRWGDDVISKNSIIIILGTTDGQTVTWARALTGMPVGNERMQVAVRNNLVGTSLTPETVLGSIRGEFYNQPQDDGSSKTKVRGIGEYGALGEIVWGQNDPSTKYTRVSMSADDPNDVGLGFKYLDGEIEPSTGWKVGIVIITLFLSLIIWGVAILIGPERVSHTAMRGVLYPYHRYTRRRF